LSSQLSAQKLSDNPKLPEHTEIGKREKDRESQDDADANRDGGMPVENKLSKKYRNSNRAKHSGSGDELCARTKTPHLLGVVTAAKKLLTPLCGKLLNLWNG
jgi:hypothetical protein